MTDETRKHHHDRADLALGIAIISIGLATLAYVSIAFLHWPVF